MRAMRTWVVSRALLLMAGQAATLRTPLLVPLRLCLLVLPAQARIQPVTLELRFLPVLAPVGVVIPA